MQHRSETEKNLQKLRLLQLIAKDTPTIPVDTEEWFCILLLDMQLPDAPQTAPGQFEPLLEQLSPAVIPVQYGSEYVVLFSGQRQRFLEDYRQLVEAYLIQLRSRCGESLCYVVSPPVGGVNLIPRAYRIAKTEFDQRVFRKERPAVFLSIESAQAGEEPLSAAGKDMERRLFLKLVNLDFDGAAACVLELVSAVGESGSSDVSLLKLRLFCLLENAAYYLAFRAGKDQALLDVMPHYLGSFLSAADVDVLSEQTFHLIRLLEQEFSPSDSSVSKLINRMLGYFSDHYMEQGLTVASAAAQFHMSPQQLARDFKKLVGVSPSVYLMQLRLDRAKQLLLDTAMSNEQIAQHVGFGNVKRLYRALQRSDGVTPGQFRKGGGAMTQ